MNPDSNSLNRITAEASEWFIAIRTGELSLAERQRFAAWLEVSPVHVQEYLGVAEIWGTIKSSSASVIASAEELINASKSTTNVVMLAAASHGRGDERARGYRPTTIAAAVILAMIAAVLTAATLVGTWREHIYSTARGEQRSIVLEDGSVIQLNTLSKIVVHFDHRFRRVELKEGEAYFRVAHDTKRPFDVVTPVATVRAVGTQFNVYSRDDKLKVAVVDGRVRVLAAGKGGSGPDAAVTTPAESVEIPLSLGANEVVELSGQDAVVTNASVSVAHATSWMQRRLTFDNERLDAVIAEFNRYTTRQMQVEGQDLAGLRISGVFDVDEPETLVSYLERIQSVNVTRQGRVITFSRGATQSFAQ